MVPRCILAHPVGTTCNIACGYCFHRYTDMTDFNRRMSVSTFLSFYAAWVRAVPAGSECEVIWHGGEPTLRGRQFYEQVLPQSNALTPAGIKITHCLQTNGVLVDESWADLFARHNVQVGVSIDGPQELHDHFRILSNGQGTFAKAIRAYRLLESRGAKTGIVVVVNRLNARQPDRVLAFMREYGIKRIQLSPCLECGGEIDNYSVSPPDFAAFVCRLYDYWVTAGDTQLSIGFVSDVVNHLLGRDQYNCLLGDRCDNFAVLDWTGELKTCDGMKDRQGVMASAGEQLADAAFGERWEIFHRRISRARSAACGGCEWYQLCHGGCPYHWPKQGAGTTAFCEAHCQIFTHIASSIQSIYGR